MSLAPRKAHERGVDGAPRDGSKRCAQLIFCSTERARRF
jgi:hypothetical protein